MILAGGVSLSLLRGLGSRCGLADGARWGFRRFRLLGVDRGIVRRHGFPAAAATGLDDGLGMGIVFGARRAGGDGASTTPGRDWLWTTRLGEPCLILCVSTT